MRLRRHGPRPRTGRRGTRGGRGQSLVEFAITLPVVLLMVLFGIDFGRVYLGWVTLNNAVREAANFAAINPTAWGATGSAAARAEYARLVTAESAAINCDLPSPIPDPSFPSGTSLGSPAVVAVTCQFTLITPLIGGILGSPLNVSASASFPVRAGTISGTPGGGGPLPSVGTVVPTPSPIVTVSPGPVVTPSPTPVPTCEVPNLVGRQTSQATRDWTDEGFTANNLTFNPLVPPHYRIGSQSIGSGNVVPCTATMVVRP